jgi:hypothetical protein
VVLTKCDKPKVKELQNSIEDVKKYLHRAPLCYPKVLTVSARRKTGISELQGDVLAAAGIDFMSSHLRHRGATPEEEERERNKLLGPFSAGKVKMTGRPSKV